MAATTIHNMFEFDREFKSRLDFAKLTNAKVADLMMLEVLLLDEVSMLDTDCFDGICEVLSIIDHSRRPNARAADCFGPVHVLLFGESPSYNKYQIEKQQHRATRNTSSYNRTSSSCRRPRARPPSSSPRQSLATSISDACERTGA